MKKQMLVFLSVFVISACSKKTDQSVITRAIEAHQSDNFDEAIALYQEVVDDFPKSPRVPEALYALGNIYHDKKKEVKKGIEMFRKLVNEFPNHPTSSSASFLIGFIFNNEVKNYDSARVAYEDFIRRYPDNHLVPDAKFELENLGKDPAEIMKTQIEKSDRRQPLAKSRMRQHKP